jgi:hypothetical protein
VRLLRLEGDHVRDRLGGGERSAAQEELALEQRAVERPRAQGFHRAAISFQVGAGPGSGSADVSRTAPSRSAR